jgi:hypothetical protein
MVMTLFLTSCNVYDIITIIIEGPKRPVEENTGKFCMEGTSTTQE